MNLVMSQVEESIHIVDVTDEGTAMPPKVNDNSALLELDCSVLQAIADEQVERRNLEMLFVRGDGVILVSRDKLAN